MTETKRPAFSFRPLPLLGNPHVQTLLGQFLPTPELPWPTTRHILQLTDGDCLVLHDTTPSRWEAGAPVAMLLHGLTGSHASGQIRRLARRLLSIGVRVVRLDQRGTGAGWKLARRLYHAGRSEDVRQALEVLHSWVPASPLWLVGVSLGGNIALKLVGEAAKRPVPGLARVGAMNPPIDLVRCAELIVLPQNRIYENYFVRELVANVQRRERLLGIRPGHRFPSRLTLREFDDIYTAPQWGFTDFWDYYRKASAFSYISSIQIPTLILTARDDPFVAVDPFDRLNPPEHVHVHISEHGGHLGFLGWDTKGGFRWAEQRLVDWLRFPLSPRLKRTS